MNHKTMPIGHHVDKRAVSGQVKMFSVFIIEYFPIFSLQPQEIQVTLSPNLA
jgi:hypothetical protein